MSRQREIKPGAVSRGAVRAYLVVVSLLVVFPVLYAFMGAFQAPQALAKGFLHFFTSQPTLENFTNAFNSAPLMRQMINSTIQTVAQTALILISGVLFAYVLAFGRLKRPSLVFTFAMITMMIPAEGIMVANFLTITSLGLFDTVLAVFLPFAANGYAIFLLRQAFLTFPRQIYESAQLDGVGHVRFLVSFLIPLNKAPIFAVLVTNAIAAWNEYLWPLLVTQSAKSRTVQVGITQLADENNVDIGAVLAGLAVVTLPTIILVFGNRRFLTRGLTAGSDR